MVATNTLPFVVGSASMTDTSWAPAAGARSNRAAAIRDLITDQYS